MMIEPVMQSITFMTSKDPDFWLLPDEVCGVVLQAEQMGFSDFWYIPGTLLATSPIAHIEDDRVLLWDGESRLDSVSWMAR